MLNAARSRTGLLSLAVGLFTATAAVAQGPGAIAFRALTPAGQPVLDLQASDVALRIDGKARNVRSLELVTIRDGTKAPARPALATNEIASAAREVIIVLDDESIAPGKEAPIKDVLRPFIRALAPTDRIGMLSLRSTGVTIAATTDRAVIRSAIDDLKGEARRNESPAELECRTSQTLGTLKGLLASATEPRTTFVFISSGIAPLPTNQARPVLGASSGLCLLMTTHFTEVGDAASQSPSAFYVVNVIDGRATPSSDAQAGLESLAGATSAPIIRLTGNEATPLNRIAHETSAYYIATFDIAPSERDGLPRSADVRVNRNGVRVESGTSLVLARPAGKAPMPTDMLHVTDEFRGLPLRTTGWATRDGANTVKVFALFEPIEAGVKLTSAMVALIDGSRIVAQWTAESRELERSPVLAVLSAAPGRYRLRVAATDSSDRRGAVDYPVEAELTPAGSMTLSALALGVADGGLKPRVQFTAGDQGAVGYIEIYGVPKGATLTASIELAASEAGPAIATAPATIKAGASEEMRIALGGFSIGALQPGDYVMRMIISMDGKPAGTAVRTMRKSK